MTASDTETTGGTITTGAAGGEYLIVKSNGGTTTKGFCTILGGIHVAIT